MALTYSSMLELGTQMPNFELENTVNNEIFLPYISIALPSW